MNREKLYPRLIVSIVVINFLLRIPFLNLPAHHDEFSYLDAARKIYNNNLNPFIEYWSYKPPFMFEITALIYKLFGPSRWGARLVISIFSSLAIAFTYLLGKLLFSRTVGFFAAVLLFVSPLFLIQSNLFQVDIVVTALTLSTYYLYFSKKWVLYLISASFLILSKETAILNIIILSIFYFITNFKKHAFTNISRTVFILSPISLFILWMVINNKIFGWYLWPHNLTFFSLNKPFEISLELIALESYVRNLFGIMYAFIIATLLLSLEKRRLVRLKNKQALAFLTLFSVFMPLFFYLGAFLPRYILFTYPLVFISFIASLEAVFIKKINFIKIIPSILISIYVLSSLYSVISRETYWDGEANLGYLRYIFIHKKAIRKIEEKYRNRIIASSWPSYQMMSDDFYGYATKDNKNIVFIDDDRCEWLKEHPNSVLLIPSYFGSKPYSSFERCILLNDGKLIDKIELDTSLFKFTETRPVTIYEFSKT